jgi:hypothetical protein
VFLQGRAFSRAACGESGSLSRGALAASREHLAAIREAAKAVERQFEHLFGIVEGLFPQNGDCRLHRRSWIPRNVPGANGTRSRVVISLEICAMFSGTKMETTHARCHSYVGGRPEAGFGHDSYAARLAPKTP